VRTPDLKLRREFQQALRTGPATTSRLARELKVTLQTVRRLLAEIPSTRLLKAGGPRTTRYALRRPLRGSLEGLPLFAVDDKGHIEELPGLSLIEPDGALLQLERTNWPAPAESREGWWDGLPYPVYAMRPSGYMGRLLARAEHINLGVAADPDEWSDDDIVWVLSRRGSDVSGNLILGDAAYDRWLHDKVSPPTPLVTRKQRSAYVDLALQALTMAGGGSSAAGEFPKFAALRDLPDCGTPHVLVKFSGGSGSTSEQRWGDLLVCEHLALASAATLPGISSARSRVLQHSGRVFFETERFDRIGMHGRLPICSLDAIDPAFLGSRETNWPVLADRLQQLGLIAAADVEAIEKLWWFGRLIANNDMHTGNLSFHVERTLRPAPAYDMLPMGYAPLPGGEVPPRTFTPDLPQPRQRPAWLVAAGAAMHFWRTASRDVRISEMFRSICAANAARVERLAEQV
jgi:hypothetical protein